MCEEQGAKDTTPGIMYSESGDLEIKEKAFRKHEHQRCLPMTLESTTPIMTKREFYVLTLAAGMLPGGCYEHPPWLDKHGHDVIEAAEKMADMMLNKPDIETSLNWLEERGLSFADLTGICRKTEQDEVCGDE